MEENTPSNPFQVITASTGNHGMAVCHAMSALSEAQRESMKVVLRIYGP
jgi:threonine dehydratase